MEPGAAVLVPTTYKRLPSRKTGSGRGRIGGLGEGRRAALHCIENASGLPSSFHHRQGSYFSLQRGRGEKPGPLPVGRLAPPRPSTNSTA